MTLKRFFAKEVNGKGYIFDKEFSLIVPSNVEKTIDFAKKQVIKLNKQWKEELKYMEEMDEGSL
ncbi:hypothetical protein [uncultured Clostridium sp.]|uniref:hypothetical protein n=1 Tax=uncultured Clostridium sp. TaxID=59620 RepID=UPI00260365BF|nr:hypothetical protein [uncultured Clostridium sp.]